MTEKPQRPTGALWSRDRWRQWGIMRGDNVSGMLTAISTTTAPTVTVFLGYLGALYQKTATGVAAVFSEPPINRIRSFNDGTDASLTIETFADGGFLTSGAAAYLKTETPSKVTMGVLYASNPVADEVVLANYVLSLGVPLALNALAADPTEGTPADGWIYYNTASDKVRVYANGAWTDLGGSAMKVTGGGYYLIPAGPSVGTTVASSASADTYGSWVEMRAAAGNALYIVGVSLYALNTEQYTQLDIGTGASASETSVSEVLFNTDGTNGIDQTVYLPYPIAVAASTRIACRTADEDASARNSRVTLIVVDQADVAAL